MKVGIRIQGVEELERALGSLSTRVSRKVAREALEYGGELIRADAASHAPRRPPAPDLADNIVMAPARTIENETAAIKIGPAKGFGYGLPQEIGTSRHQAQPFMRPAFDNQKHAVLARIGEELWRALASRGFSRSVSSDAPISSPGGGGLL